MFTLRRLIMERGEKKKQHMLMFGSFSRSDCLTSSPKRLPEAGGGGREPAGGQLGSAVGTAGPGKPAAPNRYVGTLEDKGFCFSNSGSPATLCRHFTLLSPAWLVELETGGIRHQGIRWRLSNLKRFTERQTKPQLQFTGARGS